MQYLKHAKPWIDLGWEVLGCPEQERSPNDYWAEINCSPRQRAHAFAAIMTGDEGVVRWRLQRSFQIRYGAMG